MMISGLRTGGIAGAEHAHDAAQRSGAQPAIGRAHVACDS
jgi:hypothetical protein